MKIQYRHDSFSYEQDLDHNHSYDVQAGDGEFERIFRFSSVRVAR